MARPMLDRWEMPGVEAIHVEEQRRLVDHSIPGRTGSLLQDMGSRPARLVIAGSLSEEQDRTGFLEELRRRFASAEPVTFVADITTASTVGYVVVRDLQVRASSGDPSAYHYVVTLVESPPPQPPGNLLGLVDQQITLEAGAAVAGLAGLSDLAADAGLPSLAELVEEVGMPPDLEAALSKYDLNLDWNRLLRPLDQPMADVKALADGPDGQGALTQAVEPARNLKLDLPDAAPIGQAAQQVTDAMSQVAGAVQQVPSSQVTASAVALQSMTLPDLPGQAVQLQATLKGLQQELAAADPERAIGPLLSEGRTAGQTLEARVAAPLADLEARLEQLCCALETDPLSLMVGVGEQWLAALAPALEHEAPDQMRAAAQIARRLLKALQKGTAAHDLLGAALVSTLNSLLAEARAAGIAPAQSLREALPSFDLTAVTTQARERLLALVGQVQSADWSSDDGVNALVAELERVREEMTALRTSMEEALTQARERLNALSGRDLAEPLTRALRGLGEIRLVEVDPTDGKLLELISSLADSLERFDLAGSAGQFTAMLREANQAMRSFDLSNRLKEAIAALEQVKSFCGRVEQARTRILVALQQVLGEAETALHQARQAVDAIKQGLESELGAVRDGVAEVKSQAQALSQTLQQWLADAAGALEEARLALSGPDGKGGAVGQFQKALADLRQAVANLQPEMIEGEVEQGLQAVVQQLEELHFTGPVELALQVVEELHEKIEAIPFHDLNDLARGAIAVAKALLIQEAEKRLPPVKEELLTRFRMLRTEGPDKVLAAAEAQWQKAMALVDPLDPGAWVEAADSAYRQVAGQLEAVEPARLLQPLADGQARLVGWVEGIDPERLLVPVQDGFESLKEQTDRLDPTAILEQVRALQQQLEEALDRLDPESLIDRLVLVLTRLQAAIRTLDPEAILQPIRQAAHTVGTTIEALDPEWLFEALVELANAMERMLADLTDQATEALAQWLDQALEPIARLAESLTAPVTEALAELERAVAGLSPGALAQMLRKEAYLQLKHAVEAAVAPEERQAALARVKSLIRELDPNRLLAPLLAVHDEVVQIVQELRTGWESAVNGLTDLAGAARGAILRVLPPWAAERPILRDRIIEHIRQSGLGKLVGELKRAYEPLRRIRRETPKQVAELERLVREAVAELAVPGFDSAALGTALQEACAAVREQLVASLSLGELETELGEMGEAVQQLIAAFDPRFLATATAPVLEEVRQALQALDPAPLIATLDQIYTGQVLPMVDGLSPRALVEPELTDLFKASKAKLHDLNLRHLARPALKELDRLGQELERELDRLFDRVKALPEAIPVGGG